MPPSLVRPAYDAAADCINERATSAEDRMPLAGAGAVIIALSVAAWIIVIQGARAVSALIG